MSALAAGGGSAAGVARSTTTKSKSSTGTTPAAASLARPPPSSSPSPAPALSPSSTPRGSRISFWRTRLAAASTASASLASSAAVVAPPAATTPSLAPPRQQQPQQHHHQKQQQHLQPSQLDAALSVCASVEQVLWLLQAPPASSAAAATRPEFLAAALRHACSLLRQQQQQQVVRAEVRVALAATALARLADHLAAAAVVAGQARQQPPTLPLDALAPLLLSVAVLKDGRDWSVGHRRLHRPSLAAAPGGGVAVSMPTGGGSPAAASAAALVLALGKSAALATAAAASASSAAAAPSPLAGARGLDRLTQSVEPEEVCLHAALASASLPEATAAAGGGGDRFAASTAAYALARLGPGAARPPPQLCSALAAAVLGGGGGGAGAVASPLPPKELALGLWGLATLRIPFVERSSSSPSSPSSSPLAQRDEKTALIRGMCAATLPRLGSFNAQDLSQVLWSLATARARVPRPWLVAAARALRERAAEASAAQQQQQQHLPPSSRRQRFATLAPQAAANASWALAVLLPRSLAAEQDDDNDDDSSLARTASLLGSCAADAIVAAAADAAAGSSFSSSSAQLASNAAWAAARLAQQMRSASSSSSSADHSSRSAAVAAVEASLCLAAEHALWGGSEDGAATAFFFSSSRRQHESLPTLRDCANALWACAVLRLDPPLAWQEALWQRSSLSLADAALSSSSFSSSSPWLSSPVSAATTASSVGDLAWAAARMRLSPPRAWRVALSRAALACLPRMTRQQLANGAWASVRLLVGGGGGVAAAAPAMPAGESAAWWRAWAAAAADALAEEGDDAAVAAARDASLMLFAVGTSRSASPHAMVASAALADPLWLRRCVSAVARGAAAAVASKDDAVLLPEVARSSAMALFAAAHLASNSSGSNGSNKTPLLLLPAVVEAWPALAAPLQLLAGGSGARALDGEHTAMALWAVGRIAAAGPQSLLDEAARAAAQRLQERAADLASGTNGRSRPLSRTTLARLLTALASAGPGVPAPGPRVVEPVFRAFFDGAQDGDGDELDAEAAAAALALLTRTGSGAVSSSFSSHPAAWPAALRRDVARAAARSWFALDDPRRAAACISGLARLAAFPAYADDYDDDSAPLGRAWLSAAQWRSLRHHLPRLQAMRDLGAMLSGFASLSVRARCAPSPEWVGEAARAVLSKAGGAVKKGGIGSSSSKQQQQQQQHEASLSAEEAAALSRAALGLARMAHASTGWRGQRYGGGGNSSSSAMAPPSSSSSSSWAPELAALLAERVFGARSAAALPGGTLRRAAAALVLLLRLAGEEEEEEGDQGVVSARAAASAHHHHPVVLAALERSAEAGALELGHLAGVVAALRLPLPADRGERLVTRAALNGVGGARSERYARALLKASGWGVGAV